MRLHDHAALHEALQSAEPVQPVFIFDSEILKRFTHKQDRRLTFLAQTLQHMHQQLKAHGGGMLVLYGDARTIIPKLAQYLNAKQVVCAEDYAPDTMLRDDAVRTALSPERLVQVIDHVIHHPGAIHKDDGSPLRVFTPYSKRWRAALNKGSYAEKPVLLNGRLKPFDETIAAVSDRDLSLVAMDNGVEAMLSHIGYEKADIGEWRIDTVDERLKHFIENRLGDYKDRRDFLADDGTSKLSPYLRFGLVSIRECCRLAAEKPGKGSDGWVSELIWREFYQHILFHFPDSTTLEFQEQYRNLPWRRDEADLQAWKEGKTGFPIVDAAMRQLSQTGWMHNRARMVVASFLTKDLHLDWRLGEEHFAQYLMDYELASNVGGWQWAASTGTDAQPYFRIFNPELQSKRFDPNGEYIRSHVAELREVEGDAIHAPFKAKDLFSPLDYPQPMVDHHAEKDKAIAMFKQAAA